MHVQMVEDSQKRRGVSDVRRPRPQDQEGPAVEATEPIWESISSPSSRRGNRVLGIVTLRGVQHLGEADPNRRGAIKVRYSVLRRTMLSVTELTMESVDRALVPATVVVRLDTWS